MLDKQVQQPNFVVFDLGDLAHDCVGNEVATPRLGRQGEGFLEPRHVVDWRRMVGGGMVGVGLQV